MSKFRFLILTIMMLLSASISLNAQDMSLDQLAKEGARIGRKFRAAVEMGDVNGQNAALGEIDAILVTLKKQEQVDALTNAFNNCNVPITTPSRDAVGYTMALGNAMVDGDTIGIEDANDIIATVRQQYLERPIEEQKDFEKYLAAAKAGLQLGLSAYEANGNESQIMQLEAQLSAECEKYDGDSISVKIINDMYGLFSIKITDIENDARICAEKIIKAAASGELPSHMEKAKNVCGNYFKKYALLKGEEEANKLNEKINAILEGKYELNQKIKE